MAAERIRCRTCPEDRDSGTITTAASVAPQRGLVSKRWSAVLVVALPAAIGGTTTAPSTTTPTAVTDAAPPAGKIEPGVPRNGAATFEEWHGKVASRPVERLPRGPVAVP
jgi:hypothetical protein